MPVKIQCPNPACRRAGNIPDDFAGKTVRCPHCKTKFPVGDPGPETVEHVPEPQPETAEYAPGAGKGPGIETISAQGSTPTLSGPGGATLSAPAAIGRFQVRGVLGAGAFGTVYRAFDPQLDREVALKVPQAGALDSPLRVERFLREAKAAARLRHASIVPIYEAGQAGEHFFIASALIEGQSLAQLIEAGPLEMRRAVQIVRALAEALACAHDSGIVHRDIKPANVMIDTHGLPLLMDFGLAHHRQEAAAKLTQQGALLGTPAYMAPEQARGQTDDPLPATDQYSLGVVLYELLCGQRPFRGALEVILFNTINTPPRAPRELQPLISVELEQICLRSLRKQPAERFANCKVLADALTGWLDGATSAEARPDQHRQPVRSVPNFFGKAEPRPVKREPLQSPPAKADPQKRGHSGKLVVLAGVALLVLAPAYFLSQRSPPRLPLDGTWIVESMEVGGKRKPDAKGIAWVIKGEALATQGNAAKGSIKTDASTKPSTIDVIEDLANPGLSAAGICELDGETLKICFGTREGKRPSEFSSTAKNGHSLVVMKQKAP